jgi:WD40 repeat protein
VHTFVGTCPDVDIGQDGSIRLIDPRFLSIASDWHNGTFVSLESIVYPAQLGADDGTLAWSPDGSQLFVYGGTGSFLVDAATGDVTRLGFIAGYGSITWVPG